MLVALHTVAAKENDWSFRNGLRSIETYCSFVGTEIMVPTQIKILKENIEIMYGQILFQIALQKTEKTKLNQQKCNISSYLYVI